MYIINKVVSDYEGTWSNALMYETDLDKAKKIVDELQESVISLKKIMLNIARKVHTELKKTHPNFHDKDKDMEFEQQLQSIVPGDEENYFDKETRLYQEFSDKYLNQQEKFLYDLFHVRNSSGLIYFDIQQLLISDEVFARAKVGQSSFSVVYGTKEKAQEHKQLFETLILEYEDDAYR